MIFNIQRFSTHDGQGIRTMIFYKGCPLKCEWCCNPESQSYGFSLMYDPKRCKNFGDCLNTGSKAISSYSNGITIDWSSVDDPGRFRNICASRALTVSGDEMTITEILTEIEKDMPFYKMSEGGVTLSGGEPLSQENDLLALMTELKRRSIEVTIETSLHVPWDMVKRCIDLTGTFLVDLKHTDNKKFKRFTGGNAGQVMTNLIKLAVCHQNIIIRVPVIPDFNHTYPEIKKIIDFSVSLKTVREIHFLPFHTLGSEKYKMLGMKYSFAEKKQLVSDDLKEYVSYARSVGLLAIIGG